MTTAEKRVKELETFMEDAHAFILWTIDHDKREMIGPTLGHDMAGLLAKNECFSPRVTGYAETK